MRTSGSAFSRFFAFLRPAAGPAAGRSSRVDIPPMFSKGDVRAYLARNLRYPRLAQLNNIEGRVHVRFCVTESGSVDDVAVLQSAHPLLDAAAVDAIQRLPRWMPGRSKDAARDGAYAKVKVPFAMPVSFRLQDAAADGLLVPVPATDVPDRYPWLSDGGAVFSAPQYRIVPNPSKRKRALAIRAVIEPDGTVSDLAPAYARWAVRDPSIFETFCRSLEAWPPRAWTPALNAGQPVRCPMLLALSYGEAES